MMKITPLCLAFLMAFLSACSPYVYEKEIKAFGDGVSLSSQTMQTLEQQHLTDLQNKRDNELIKQKASIDFSNGCDELRKKYVDSIQTGQVLNEKAYQDCYATPKGTSVDPNLNHIAAIIDGLNRYSAALVRITTVGDEDALKQAYTDMHNSEKQLLEALNKKLSEKQQQQFDLVSDFVWTVGNIVLNQRRFDTLKKGVNRADPIVQKASKILREAAFYLHEKKVNQNYRTMLRYATTVDTSSDYLEKWKQMDQYTADYVDSIKNSPVYSFDLLAQSHTALKQSLDNPSNQAQLYAVLENVNRFKQSAESAYQSIHPSQSKPAGEQQ